ncbi:nucleotidyltransferase family protein [Mucilaginibacter sp.]|uniref:nucleotidyltransferase family protein n=1 Tax=Mucilaginibacter sp. TaxID=1882438 RepID=UPI00283B50CC|nr:nucleotidyltransferase family protein [Mucilaginibacter sp.]MDR3697517.1 nucleotidyltransferase family protein [Mucilaginibacter sp.]
MFSKEKLCEIYNNEQVLMVLLSRLYFDKCTGKEVQDFIDGSNINWEFFRRLIKVHQVRPFIYHIIKSNALNADGLFLEKLKKDAVKVSIINLHQLRFLNGLLRELKHLGVKVIPYKGVLFGSRYYQSHSHRESSDVDLFVDKNDVKKIRAYFRSRHYIANEDVPDDYLNYMILFYRDISFKTPVDALNVSCTIEIQWKLVDGFVGKYADFDFFGNHLEDFDIGGNKLSGLTATHEFMCIISNHFYKEHFNRFKYVIDTACFLSKKDNEIDKAAIACLVKEYRFKNFFNGSVQCLEELLGIKYSDVNPRGESGQIILNNAISYPVKRNEKNDRIVFDLQDNYANKLILMLRRLLYFILPNYNDIVAFNRSALFLPVLFILKPIRLLSKYFDKHNIEDK